MLSNFRKKQKRDLVKTLAFAGTGILIVAVFFGLMIADLRMHQKKKQLNAHLESLEQKVKQMQAKNKKLKEGISQSDSPEYIEKVAREELGLQQPGETVVSFVQSGTQEIPKEKPKENILQQMIGALTGWLR